jgi:hypothetical protein
MSTTDSISIRAATSADHEALARLAALDSSHYPACPALVAEEDGAIVAALALPARSVVADPFRRSGHAVALLELRAKQLAMRPVRRRGLPLPALRRRRRRTALPAEGLAQ